MVAFLTNKHISSHWPDEDSGSGGCILDSSRSSKDSAEPSPLRAACTALLI